MKTTTHNLKFILSIVVLLICTLSFAQQGINYQGVARDADSELLISTDIDLKFNINVSTPEGTSIYSETHAVSTDVNGVFSVVIGEGIPVLNTFEDINWAEDKHFLNVWLNNEEIGTTEFMSVPYTQAIGKWQAHNNGVTPKGTGRSIFIGEDAGINDDFGDNKNVGIGVEALHETTTGNNNVAIGEKALRSNRDGFQNIAIGSESLHDNISGRYNIAAGLNSLNNNVSGNYNIAIGKSSQLLSTNGHHNISLGTSSMRNNVNGGSNIAIGPSSMYSRISGSDNTAIGGGALRENSDGNGNVAIGDYAGYANITGNNNVFLGYRAGDDNLGSGNVFIGYRSGYPSSFDNASNTLIIDNTNYTVPLIYGEFDNEILAFDAKVGIGTLTPNVPLHIRAGSDVDLSLGSGSIVIGNELGTNLALDSNEIQARNAGVPSPLYLQQNGGDVYVSNAVVHASDKRLKRDIENISFGLYDLLKLRPTEYFWKGKTQEHKSLGLIAQEVEGIIENVVSYDNEKDRYGVSYTELVPVLIKAIQEQHAIIKLQQKRNNKQSKDLTDLKDRMNSLEALLTNSNQNTISN